MEFTADQIAGLVNGKIIGDPKEKVLGISPIEETRSGSISFLFSEKYAGLLACTKASVVVVSAGLLEGRKSPSTLIVVEDAYSSFQVLLDLYQQTQPQKKGIEQPSFIHESVERKRGIYVGAFSYVDEGAEIGEGTKICSHVFIGKNVKIGENCKIDSGVKIYDACVVGSNCVIHSNTVIGGDGFGFRPGKGGYEKIPQLGNVVIGDDVEIGSNCSIDRATVGSTMIGRGTKIDNLIHVAHNVRIGDHNVIAAQVGIAGSTAIGDWNMVGGQTGIIGHVSIGNHVKIQAQSGVNRNVKDKEILYGTPAFSEWNFRRSYVLFRKLPEIEKRINHLEEKSKDD